MNAAGEFHIAQAAVFLQFVEQSQVYGVYFHADYFVYSAYYAAKADFCCY
jgi:hypothetical protein